MKKAKMVAKYFNIPTTPVVVVRGSRKTHVRGTSTFISRGISATDVSIKQDSPSANPTVGAGLVIAPAAAALIADSGALPAGVYRVEVTLSNSGVIAAGKHTEIQHRNAANSATVAVKGGCPYPAAVQVVLPRVVLALNERIRVVQGAILGAASESALAHIAAHLLPV